MPILLTALRKGNSYSRKDLALKWGYKSYQALARGVFTPRDDNKIVLFVTEEKQSTEEQYQDRLIGNVLEWEGPVHHVGEDRILKASSSGDEIHLFHRKRHHTDFVYLGQLSVLESKLNTDKPSKFKFKVL